MLLQREEMSDLKANYRRIFKSHLTKISQRNNTAWLDSKIQNTLKKELSLLLSKHKEKRAANILSLIHI